MIFSNPFQVNVEVLSIIFDEEELTEAKAGDNVKLKLKGVEEDVRELCVVYGDTFKLNGWSLEYSKKCYELKVFSRVLDCY